MVRDVIGESADSRSSELACPKCGAPMVLRKNRRDRRQFWGCPNYPRCHGTRPFDAIDAVPRDLPAAPIPKAVVWDDPSWLRAEAGASARATHNRRLKRHRA